MKRTEIDIEWRPVREWEALGGKQYFLVHLEVNKPPSGLVQALAGPPPTPLVPITASHTQTSLQPGVSPQTTFANATDSFQRIPNPSRSSTLDTTGTDSTSSSYNAAFGVSYPLIPFKLLFMSHSNLRRHSARFALHASTPSTATKTATSPPLGTPVGLLGTTTTRSMTAVCTGRETSMGFRHRLPRPSRKLPSPLLSLRRRMEPLGGRPARVALVTLSRVLWVPTTLGVLRFPWVRPY